MRAGAGPGRGEAFPARIASEVVSVPCLRLAAWLAPIPPPPQDGNLDETVNSLQYATRVRTIKNNPMKEIATKEIAKLREQIRYWKEKAVRFRGRGGSQAAARRGERGRGNGLFRCNYSGRQGGRA